MECNGWTLSDYFDYRGSVKQQNEQGNRGSVPHKGNGDRNALLSADMAH